MNGDQPPDPGDRIEDINSTDDKIKAYKAVAGFYQDGVQPAVSLTHTFLQKHPILLEEDCLSVNWDWIPSLYSQTDQLLTVSISDAQWVEMGPARRVDGLGAEHPGQKLYPQHGCGSMQGGVP